MKQKHSRRRTPPPASPLSPQEAARAPTRQMTVIAQDPGVRRDGNIVMATIDVPAEDLRGGPIGYRVQVVDYDATTPEFHGSHDLPAAVSARSRKRGATAIRASSATSGSTRRTSTRS